MPLAQIEYIKLGLKINSKIYYYLHENINISHKYKNF